MRVLFFFYGCTTQQIVWVSKEKMVMKWEYVVYLLYDVTDVLKNYDLRVFREESKPCWKFRVRLRQDDLAKRFDDWVQFDVTWNERRRNGLMICVRVQNNKFGGCLVSANELGKEPARLAVRFHQDVYGILDMPEVRPLTAWCQLDPERICKPRIM